MNTKEQILHDYEIRKPLFTKEMIELFESYFEDEIIYAKYVAAYLADCDLRADINVIKDYIDHGIFLKKEFIKSDYSEEIFLNYVLHPRATKEKLDYSRSFFFEQVKELVDFSNETQTVANLNHWCASHVRYQANDARTKSPLQAYKSGIGRCGESAAFLVHVLRSVGIPARQTFVPWWTHSDSNHAWIDVYVDNQWHYVGDASGEELLDRAWFTLASTRAGLVNASVFSNVNAQEKILDDHLGVWKSINTTARYTPTKKIIINSELPGLEQVQISVFNSGSFKTMCHLNLVNNSQIFEFGAGDFFVKAYWQGELVIKKVSSKETQVLLTTQDIVKDIYKFEQNPKGVEKVSLSYESDEVIKRKIKHREQSQIAYDNKMSHIKEYGLNQEEYKKLYHLCEKDTADKILNNLALKDLEDFDAEILYEHYQIVKQFEGLYPDDIYEQYLLSPRILWEELNLYAPIYSEKFSTYKEYFYKNPRLIMDYVKENVSTNTKHHIQNTYMDIKSILDLGIGSVTDQRILAVAIARSIGIPARFNQLLDTIEFYKDDKFHNFELENEYFDLTLMGALDTVDTSIEKKSYRHQTNSSKIDKNKLTNHENTTLFKSQFEKGSYEIITSTRLPNGSIRGVLKIIELNEDLEVNLEVPIVHHEEMIEGIAVSDLLSNLDQNLKQTGLIIIGDTRTEPVSHALNETLKQKALLNSLDIPVYIKALNDSQDTKLVLDLQKMINNCQLVEGWSKDAEESLVRRVFKEPWEYPFVLLYEEGKSIISSSGYHVGTINNSWLGDVLKK